MVKYKYQRKDRYLKKKTKKKKQQTNYWWIKASNGISKMINLLDNTPNQLSKFSTKNWVEINDDSRGTYNVNTQIKLKLQC